MDKRRQRSRTALLLAFADLVRKQSYEDIRVADIVRHAKVGRSTFYDNFRGKEGLLTSSIAGPFAVLATSIRPEADVAALVQLLEHFWSHRALARGLLLGSVRRKTIGVLVSQVEQRLELSKKAREGALLMPQRLIAIQIAEVLISPITAWLLGETRCTPKVLAHALPRAARAVLGASFERPR